MNVSVASALARLFVVYGLVGVLIFAWVTPGFQNVDEVSHLIRAESVSRGQVFSPRAPGLLTGGAIDSVIPGSAAPFEPVKTSGLTVVTRDMIERSNLVVWSSARGPGLFANTAIYPPFLYVPQAVALWIGKALDWSVLRTLNLARLFAGFAAVVLGAAAIARAGRGAPLLFALLALPMSLALMASPSQDGLMLSLAALAAVKLADALRTGRQDTRDFVSMCVALALVAMARPPYLPLALLPLIAPGRGFVARLAGAAMIVGAVLGWSAVAVAVTGLSPRAGTDAGLQLAHLLQHRPLALVTDTLRTWGPFYLFSFIGQLGWLDVELPRPYYALAAGQLLLAFGLVAAIGRRNGGPGFLAPATIAVAALGSVGAIFAIQYLTWSMVGAPIVDGVQGRYFLPPAMFLVALVAGGPDTARESNRAWRLAVGALALFPALSLAVAVRALVWRYYLG